MKLYVMRHGQTDWNVRQVYQGQTDIPLNEAGLAQAQAAKEKVWPGMVDLILCSSLTRARQTAAAVNEILRVPVIYRPDMIERAFGEWEGCSYVEKRTHPYVASGAYDNYRSLERVAGVETCREVCERAWAVVEEVKEFYSDRSVLLVSHGSWLRAMSAYFRGLDETGSVGHVRMDNCEIQMFEL